MGSARRYGCGGDGGGFGHFYAYAPERLEYPINRFTMEVKRQLDVLDRNLAEREFICGDEYTIADIPLLRALRLARGQKFGISAIFWYGALAMGMLYESGEFLDVGEAPAGAVNVTADGWTKGLAVQERPTI